MKFEYLEEAEIASAREVFKNYGLESAAINEAFAELEKRKKEYYFSPRFGAAPYCYPWAYYESQNIAAGQ